MRGNIGREESTNSDKGEQKLACGVYKWAGRKGEELFGRCSYKVGDCKVYMGGEAKGEGNSMVCVCLVVSATLLSL